MLISKKNRRTICEYLFKEGVCVAKKDYNLPKHPDIDVPNLQVIKLMQSFTSREYVKEQYAWRHYYWSLTDEGIAFLREYLSLPEDVVPNTMKKSARPPVARMPEGASRPDQGPRRPAGYQRPPPGAGFGRGKDSAPSGEYRPQFRGGAPGDGRGAPRP